MIIGGDAVVDYAIAIHLGGRDESASVWKDVYEGRKQWIISIEAKMVVKQK